MIGKPIRPGFHTITPYLIVPELEPMLDFLKATFGATEHFRTTGNAGGTHIEMRIGDSMLMLSGGSKTQPNQPMPTMLFLYLEQVDAIYAAALQAGATSLLPPGPNFGEPHGAGIKDPAGNEWYFARWQDVPNAPPAFVPPATEAAMPDVIPMLAYEEGPAAMDWLANAFGFVEVARWVNAAGLLEHGEMRAGTGRIMLATPTPAYQSPKHHREHSEAARAWAAVPWVIDGVLVYVDNLDHHYAQAQGSGAAILSEPEEGEPGRHYRSEDIEGHRWMFIQRMHN